MKVFDFLKNLFIKDNIYVYVYSKKDANSIKEDEAFKFVVEEIKNKKKEVQHYEWVSFNGKGYMIISTYMPSKKPTDLNFRYWPFLFELVGELSGGSKSTYSYKEIYNNNIKY
jgi:hypothetical protein